MENLNETNAREKPQMAIMTPGPLAAALSGSVGGTVFSRNRGGAYVRNRSIPVDPNTSFQIAVRAALAAQSQNWADRSDAERNAWESWALQNPVTNALGNAIRLSGHQAYVQINSRLDLVDVSTIDVPPIENAPTGLDSLIVDGDIGVGDVDIVFTATPLAANVAIWLQAAVVNSPGITYVRNLIRFLGISTLAQASPMDIQTEVEDRFGTLIVGQTLHVRAGTFDTTTGLLSFPLSDSVLVTTT